MLKTVSCIRPLDFVLARSWSYDKTDEARLLVEHSNMLSFGWKLEMSSLGLRPRDDMSTSGQHIWMFHLQPCIICIMLCQLETERSWHVSLVALSCSGLRWQIWALWSCCWLVKGWLHYWINQHLIQDNFTNFSNLGIAVEGALCLPVAVLFGFFVTDFREHSERRKCIGCQCLLEYVALTSTH